MTHVARHANYQGSLTTPVPCLFLWFLCFCVSLFDLFEQHSPVIIRVPKTPYTGGYDPSYPFIFNELYRYTGSISIYKGPTLCSTHPLLQAFRLVLCEYSVGRKWCHSQHRLTFTLGFQTPGEEVFEPQNPTQKTKPEQVFGRLGLFFSACRSWFDKCFSEFSPRNPGG